MEGGLLNDARTADSPLAAAARPERLAEGAFLAGRYVVGAEVGRGGGGTVYQAFDQGAQLRVALKVLMTHKEPRPQSSEQLYRELRLGRSIQHPQRLPHLRRLRGGGSPLPGDGVRQRGHSAQHLAGERGRSAAARRSWPTLAA